MCVLCIGMESVLTSEVDPYYQCCEEIEKCYNCLDT